MNKTKILIIVLFFILVVILLVVFLFRTSGRIQPIPSATPTSSPQIVDRLSNQRVKYSASATKKMLDNLNNPKPLSVQDQSTRERLINSLGNKSGVFVQNTLYHIEYVKAANQFMIEIKSTDIQVAKTEAVEWLIQQGFSQEGICNLPVVFYLNSQVSRQLSGQDIIFSPLAEGC